VLLAARMFRSPDLFAGVILLGAVGFVGALALNALERRLLIWRAPSRG
jgi:ABC-type nitrate/sulfonate/bicarbonate transport system permease component